MNIRKRKTAHKASKEKESCKNIAMFDSGRGEEKKRPNKSGELVDLNHISKKLLQ